MRKLLKSVAVTVLQGSLLCSMSLAAERTVVGIVLYGAGEPVPEAAVQLEDRTTLQVISSRTDRDGHFRFAGLNPDKDYEIKATKNGSWSKTHNISRFSSRPVENVTLYLRRESK